VAPGTLGPKPSPDPTHGVFAAAIEDLVI